MDTVIFYFSSTGNSEYAAKRIGAATGQKTAAIPAYSAVQQVRLSAAEPLGIITPTYCWGLPTITAEFLSKLTAGEKPAYLWFLATYGTSPGQAGWFARRLLEPKELLPDAYFGVKMPDNWTPMFDLSDPEKVRRTNELAERQIDWIIQRIQGREKGDFMRGKVPRIAARIYYTHYEEMRKTAHFHVTEDCIGCGLCAGQCPAGAIAMERRRPVWTKPQCIMCLGCLHHCPRFAIQYGGHTKDHGQYTHPRWTP